MENLLETYPSIAIAICDPHVSIDEVTTKILSLSVQHAQNVDCSDRTAHVQSFYWSLLRPLLELSEENQTVHERIIALISEIKPSAVGAECVRSAEGGGWRESPLPRRAVYEYWNVLELPYSVTEEPALSVLEGDIVVAPSADSELGQIAEVRVKYLNMHHFLSRLWKETGIDISYFGLSIMQHIVDNCVSDGERQQKDHLTDLSMVMEADSDDDTDMDFMIATDRLVQIDSENENDEDEDFMLEDESVDEDEEENIDPPTPNLAVEAASIWVSRCAEELYHLLQRHSDSSDAVPVKWLAWKHAFKNIANNLGGRARIMGLAKSAVEKMEEVERYRLDSLYVEPICVN